jgi:hypothetical protein
MKRIGGTIRERGDLKRRRLGIPSDPTAKLAAHRRDELKEAREAKRPREPRLVQRMKKLAARKAQRERDAKLPELLRPKPVFEDAA